MSYSLCGKQLQTLCICHGAPMAEQDLQQVLQCHHFRKKLENTEGKVGSILNFPTSQARQHLVTGNFNLAISSHWGPPNIRQNDSNLRDHTVRQTWLETKFNPLLPENLVPRVQSHKSVVSSKRREQGKQAQEVMQIKLKLKFQPNLLGRNPQTRAIRRSNYYWI